jgi:hypothetical protein
MNSQIPKIVSGGQTGADRAALDWARDRMRRLVPKGSKSRGRAASEQIPSGRNSFGQLRPKDGMERPRYGREARYVTGHTLPIDGGVCAV